MDTYPGWAELGEQYQERAVVLVLGSGTSAGCDIPTWTELMQRGLDLADPHHGLDVRHLQELGLSLPTIARLIEERSGSREAFIELMRNALYQDFLFYPHDVDKSNRRQFVKYIHQNNSTLRAIGAMCARRIPQTANYEANPHIAAVVNFNLDALLQTYIYARYHKRLVRTVERASAGPIKDKISVYQMHGYLAFGNQKGDSTVEAADAAVLTEQDYFDFFNQPNSLFNFTFLYLMREYPCCFIGLSMQDDNIRRLLHYSRKEQYNGLKSKGKGQPETWRRQLLRHFVILEHNDDGAIDRAIEDTLRPLGVNALWINAFDEIPRHLGELYATTGDSWGDVFD